MNVFQFPKKQQAPARPIPREEFERLAELALDVVDRIVAMLDEPDEGRKIEPPSESEVIWLPPIRFPANLS
jgi:hypothetical protein